MGWLDDSQSVYRAFCNRNRSNDAVVRVFLRRPTDRNGRIPRVSAPHSFPNLAESDLKAGITAESYQGNPTYAFFAAALWFTPTNLAFLALLAGLLGGCGSNILVDRLSSEEAEQIDPSRMKYLVEAPWAAMMRSFIVYLCVIAGLYFAIDDPFKNSTPAQYMRLAGTISVLALLVGYDPTRIRAWIGLVPSPHSQKETAVDSLKVDLKVEAKHGERVALPNHDEQHESKHKMLITADSPNGNSDSEERAHPGQPR